MAGQYAERTKIASTQTTLQIQALLTGKGAQTFAFQEAQSNIAVGFELNGVRYRFVIPVPDADAPECRRIKGGREQLKNARMRALLMLLKAKLEAVAIGASTLEEELLPAVVMPSGQTVGQWARTQILDRYALEEMPPMLALGSGK